MPSNLEPANGSPENMPAALSEQLDVPCDQVESWHEIKKTRTGTIYVVQLKSQHGTAAFETTSRTVLVGTGTLAEGLETGIRRAQFVKRKGKAVTLIITADAQCFSRLGRDASSSLERFIGERYAALTELPEEDLRFAAEIWPQVHDRTAWLEREQLFDVLVDRDLAGGVDDDEGAFQRAFVHLRAWMKNNAVISVKLPGEYFPLFQFGGDGEPLPVIARLNALWPPRTSGLAKAAWLLAPNPNLRNAVPADLLAADPDRLVQALELEHSIVH